MRVFIGATLLVAATFWALVVLAFYDRFGGTGLPFREGDFFKIVALNSSIASIATLIALGALVLRTKMQRKNNPTKERENE